MDNEDNNPFEGKSLSEVILDYQNHLYDKAEEENRRKLAAHDARIAKDRRQQRKEFLEAELAEINKDIEKEEFLKKYASQVLSKFLSWGHCRTYGWDKGEGSVIKGDYNNE